MVNATPLNAYARESRFTPTKSTPETEAHYVPHNPNDTVQAHEPPHGEPCAQEVDCNALATYLRDHLAGGDTAVGTLRALQNTEIPAPLSEVIEWVVPDIEEDKRTLERMIHSLDVKQTWWRSVGAWFAAKVSSWKFWHRVSGDLGHLEVLEVLSIGILGKRALWRVLSHLQATTGQFAGSDFHALIARAERQYDAVEHARMRTASGAFLLHRKA
jgi:hypothetical protein